MKDGPFDRPDSRFNTLKGWTWIGCYGGYYLQSDLLHEQGFEHGSSPGSGTAVVLMNWRGTSAPASASTGPSRSTVESF